MNIPVRIDGKGDAVGYVVAFVGGDHYQWAIVQWGERFTHEAIENLRAVSQLELEEDRAFERSRRALRRRPPLPSIGGVVPSRPPFQPFSSVTQAPVPVDPDRPRSVR